MRKRRQAGRTPNAPRICSFGVPCREAFGVRPACRRFRPSTAIRPSVITSKPHPMSTRIRDYDSSDAGESHPSRRGRSVRSFHVQSRRSFLKLAAGTGALVELGDLGFLGQLAPVSAAEAKLDPKMVQLHAEIEPLV